ncbi:unnamed protein product [Rotaria socialis]|uniref:SWIM-type domain-containing protein n=1 Tax=Rotaria socialis TaxID=392032 RepID=A0A821C207_9BILA|nr:unnamed protein product [Rotaria socialis]CAF3266987.1 unnamed protein product [Rotaria socialis]CAF3375878.1 unnamed protein product [Rotaria socialis]CAF3499777.1 unnamed protein product [Rotaria socialis]CAF4452492.1 unnamed protein product [Rotaria socialis]
MANSSSPSFISIVDYKRPFNIDVSSITEYFCSVLASDGSLDRGALRNGNLLFKNHFVHAIAISRRFIEITVTAKCRAQMKKAGNYQMKLILNSNRPADIIQATCECVAGHGPRAACKHLAALCFGLLDYDDKKLYDACTQRLQEWHQPTRRSTNPVPLSSIDFGCLQHDTTEQQTPQYAKFLKDYIYVSGAQRALHQLLIKYNQDLNIAASFFLSQQEPTSFIALPGRVVTQTSVSFDYSVDLSIVKHYYDNIHLSSTQISILEQATRGQSSCSQWHKERKFRISGTNVYSICVEKHHFQKLAKSILKDKDQDLSSIPAVRHGILNEEICRRRYVLEQTKNREKILFTDENKFELGGIFNRQNDHVYAPSRHDTDEHKGAKPTAKFPKNLMVWLAASKNGLSLPIIFEPGETLTHEKYVDIILPHARAECQRLLGDDFIYQQDNATSHKHKVSIA